jgi:D-glycero-D-manno-heptose 1,7-bisphosphate phosphatase
MLHRAAGDLNLDLAGSWMIGDSARDIIAGRAAGCRTILLTASPDDPDSRESRPDFTAADLVEAANIVIRQDGADR